MSKLLSLLRLAWKAAHILLLIGGVLFYAGAGVWAAKFRTSFVVAGHVEDADTGQRVSHAKVIVTAWKWWGFDATPYKFGTVTDEQGNFQISASPGFIIAWRDVMVSSPDNKYAEIRHQSGDYAPLAVRQLTYWERELDTYHYRTFEGCWVGETTWLQ